MLQGQLEARHGNDLECKYFKPGQCIHHCGIVSGTGPVVSDGPDFLGRSLRRHLEVVYTISFMVNNFRIKFL